MNEGNTISTTGLPAGARPRHERVIVAAAGTGVLQEIEVTSGQGRQTTDQIQVFIRAEDGTETLARSAMLPAQTGARTLPNLTFTGRLVARGNLTNLTFRGLCDDGTAWEHVVGSTVGDATPEPIQGPGAGPGEPDDAAV